MWLDLWKEIRAVPPDYVYSRFLKKLMKEYSHFIDEMFDELVEMLTELLPDFGEALAIDGKAIQSFANRKSDKEPDGRRDVDANWSKKEFAKICPGKK